MTPLPKPLANRGGTRPLSSKLHVPMTAGQYLRWRSRRKPAPMPLPTPAEIEAGLARIFGRPFFGDRVEAAADGAVGDEVDAGYLAAIRLAPRMVGTEAGQVPPAVADRLYDAGLIRKVDSPPA